MARKQGPWGKLVLVEFDAGNGVRRRVQYGRGDLGALREQALRDGMKPLRASGALKVAAGVTTIEEVLKVAPPVSVERRGA